MTAATGLAAVAVEPDQILKLEEKVAVEKLETIQV
jgi:hypothetical protein